MLGDVHASQSRAIALLGVMPSRRKKGLNIKVPGFVTLPCREREVSAAQELSGRCDCRPPRVHRRGAKRAVRSS